MHKRQRHHSILQILASQKVITVQELTQKLKASPATVRRDIGELAELYALRKIHGGAEALDANERPKLDQVSFAYGNTINVEQKRAIAQRAVALCEDDESIIINGGTTTYQMVEYLEDRKLQILTNSLPIANCLFERTDNRIQLPGGEVYRDQHIIVSPFEDDTIKNYYASKLFMGAQALTLAGLLENDPRLIQAERKLLSQTDQLIVLVDSSKFKQRGSLILRPLSEIDVVITDDGIDTAAAQMLEHAGIETIVVEAARSEAA